MTVANESDELGKMIADVTATIEKEEASKTDVIDDTEKPASDSKTKEEEPEDETEVETAKSKEEPEKGSEEWIEKEAKERAEKIIQKRIAKATWQRKTAEEQRDALKLQLEQANKVQAPEKARLTKEDFLGDEQAYIEHVAQQQAMLLMQSQDKARTDYNAKIEKQREINNKWAEAINEYATVKPDIRQVLDEANEIQLSTDILNEILEGDSPAAIVYHMAQNPNEALKLSSMSEKARTRYLTKLEIKLESNATTEPTKEIKPVESESQTQVSTTKAPAPIGIKNAKSIQNKGKDPILEFLNEWDDFDKKRNY